MRLEGAALKDNPLLIQKIIAEKLSDKVQIMMVPSDGKYLLRERCAAGRPSDAPHAPGHSPGPGALNRANARINGGS